MSVLTTLFISVPVDDAAAATAAPNTHHFPAEDHQQQHYSDRMMRQLPQQNITMSRPPR